ncbi:hypothetical protein BT96DRAFT_961574 [Gymnopus androsaceus JB14]|uniref:Ino eighty subunit 1 n=1 Tax=Gymnopus androsaceus JB14 TaxID=1447944 RepID=A0A6A4IN46_9AGAR|nr:hypothetical protein BT96DRAFT_961574 [Gymnopus androsaceus JB14]
MSDSSWPPEPIPPIGYLSRKALPIKRNDAEMLTREDVQYDLLEYIFADNTAVFTPQTPGPPDKVTFRDLYVNALYHSNKCSKVLKEKMVETPQFGVELAKISILTNVGRINTTMAFFPEMKTALRTYHPVPSLQKTDGNAQDAPRIKNCLKAALLPSEFRSIPPSSPEEVLERRRAGHCPPTSIVNLVFVLSNHAAPLSTHFDGINFLDLFLPKPLASPDRGRAFLWMIYHYLESEAPPNPFDIPHAPQIPGKAPYIRPLTHAEMMKENVDTLEEIEWGKRMSAQRNLFLQKLVTSMESEKKTKPAAPHFVPTVPNPNTPATRTRSSRRHQEPSKEDGPFMYYVPGEDTSTPRPKAWRSVMTSDPLLDSDEENGNDDELRTDYGSFVHVYILNHDGFYIQSSRIMIVGTCPWALYYRLCNNNNNMYVCVFNGAEDDDAA